MSRYFNSHLASVLMVYLRCPTTGKTIEGLKGDDKAMCNCPEAQSRGGTHLVSMCAGSTVDQWMFEHDLTDGEDAQ